MMPVPQTKPAYGRDLEACRPVYDVEFYAIGYHRRIELTAGEQRTISKPDEATHIMMQTENQAIRYRIDGRDAGANAGFRLSVNSVALVPVPLTKISLYPLAAGAVVQLQWVG